ncbi:serine/threonine protein kinase [Calidifontimicrobium sp. SYSU G02091]|uniref:serine/threonine-protein kinase n=1 Tax=Calidifontimicrobium sp. SYSU G02091 TaxID=2926421 RepID=UPI001F53B187|nr:serine/threonine-protein kinase [Calidifontimicrobium sp. SYSU G02091]MCI1190385.1 serine/threonine protein kinase [Calidifontimicrobium sp. SYSU G02091]
MNASGPGDGTTGRPPRAAALAPGAAFAGVRIERLLARGSSASLYVAVEPRSTQRVALKVLDACDADAARDDAVMSPFAREAQTLQRLRHPSIVEVLGGGVEGAHPYLLMALLPGTDLRRYAAPARRLPEPLVLKLGADVADALAHAHAMGVVHRDLKPANLVFDAATRRVWITDFGVARALDAARTRTGVLLGTPAFMAPEQLAGGAPSAAGDVYALGVTLFQLLAGTLPYAGETMGALLRAMAQGATRTLAELRPDLPPALADLLAQALSREASQRPTAAEFALHLRRLPGTVV